MPRRVLVGVVASGKVSQLRRVEIERTVRHRKYKKIIRRRTVCHVHDENNESAVGDKVEIEESAPMSKLKRWRLLRVIEKNKEVDMVTLRAQRTRVGEVQETLEQLSGEGGQTS